MSGTTTNWAVAHHATYCDNEVWGVGRRVRVHCLCGFHSRWCAPGAEYEAELTKHMRGYSR